VLVAVGSSSVLAQIVGTIFGPDRLNEGRCVYIQQLGYYYLGNLYSYVILAFGCVPAHAYVAPPPHAPVVSLKFCKLILVFKY
jgi:hypothetical protein